MRKLIIDSGHGIDTKGKRSIFHKMIYKGNKVAKMLENEFNEAVANKLSVLYDFSEFITPEYYDISLQKRMVREHNAYFKNSIFLSIHADAYHVKDTAKGGRFYYYSKKGYDIANYLTDYLRNNGYELGLRPPKQANFYVLKNSKSVAVLFEAGFMTTESDLNKLMSDKFRNKTAILLNEAIKKL